MASDSIPRRPTAARPRRPPTTRDHDALPVAARPEERRFAPLLLAAAPVLLLGGCDPGGDEGGDEGDGDD